MRGGERWVFLFLLGTVAFNWPFLTIFEGSLPSMLFLLWALFIAAAAFLASRESRGGDR